MYNFPSNLLLKVLVLLNVLLVGQLGRMRQILYTTHEDMTYRETLVQPMF